VSEGNSQQESGTHFFGVLFGQWMLKFAELEAVDLGGNLQVTSSTANVLRFDGMIPELTS
jgi:hypothetical protein